MQTDVLTVSPETGVTELVQLLAEEEISGAPVVERDGHVVGVVSATDVVRQVARVDAGNTVGAEGGLVFIEPTDVPDDAEDVAYFVGADEWMSADLRERMEEVAGGLEGVTVRDIMTPAVFTVRAEATLPELARFLVRAGIHRALVMERGRLKGIVTATDVLESVAEESESGAAPA
jgi:CBS domain-containing protein